MPKPLNPQKTLERNDIVAYLRKRAIAFEGEGNIIWIIRDLAREIADGRHEIVRFGPKKVKQP